MIIQKKILCFEVELGTYCKCTPRFPGVRNFFPEAYELRIGIEVGIRTAAPCQRRLPPPLLKAFKRLPFKGF